MPEDDSPEKPEETPGQRRSRPLPEESEGIEGTIRELVDHPIQIEFPWDGKVIKAETWAGHYIARWETTPELTPPANFVRQLSGYFYGELKYWTEWDVDNFTVVGNYKFEGLLALSRFFSDETADNIRGFQIRDLEELPDCIPEDTEYAEACRFEEWVKGFHLALLQFGELDHGHSIFKGLMAEFGTDLKDDFNARHRKVAEKKFRERIYHLKRYALAWDRFPVPLRYFTDEAALEFMQERYNYAANDLDTFRKVFRKGGSKRLGRGLEGLQSHNPPIVNRWNSASGFSSGDQNYRDSGSVSVREKAAIHHGFAVEDVVSALAQLSGRRVSLC